MIDPQVSFSKSGKLVPQYAFTCQQNLVTPFYDRPRRFGQTSSFTILSNYRAKSCSLAGGRQQSVGSALNPVLHPVGDLMRGKVVAPALSVKQTPVWFSDTL
jgi:hypothetical protein